MLRRLAASEHGRVRSLRARPGSAVAAPVASYHADDRRLRALLTAELTRSLPDLAQALVERMGEASDVALHAHPDDLARLGAIDARIARVADATLARGGCRVHGATGELDATVETRVAQLLAAAQVKS